MVDIRDLARRSGVSAATVSRALNDRADVSPQTRARIIELARELGYSPSQPARTLVRKRSDTIGLIWDTGYETDGRRHPFLQDLLIALKRPLSDAGYHLMLLATAPADAGVDTYLRAARQHSLDGVILMGVDERHPAITSLLEAEFACVAVDLPLHGPRTTYVSSDNRAGAATAVAHLHSLGRRRIAIVTGPLSLLPASDRLAGYRYQAARLGLPFRPEYVVHGDFFLASGYEAARGLLALPEPPDAIFLAGDEMAIGALHAIADAGLSVPDDIAVVGFDDIESAALVRPALTTIAQDPNGLCVSAVDALLKIIGVGEADGRHKPQAFPAPRVLPTRLVVRDSCGGRPEPSRPEASRPEAGRPEISRPEHPAVRNPAVRKSAVRKTSRPETSRHEISRSEAKPARDRPARDQPLTARRRLPGRRRESRQVLRSCGTSRLRCVRCWPNRVP